ncbi:hypothetical protein [Streptomyces sp. BH104]|uniref:hypothetical protein n=1 Tax=Streptomyces sp. BH104 TaxID=3410407 RepID=UPI003BB6DBBC
MPIEIDAEVRGEDERDASPVLPHALSFPLGQEDVRPNQRHGVAIEREAETVRGAMLGKPGGDVMERVPRLNRGGHGRRGIGSPLAGTGQ